MIKRIASKLLEKAGYTIENTKIVDDTALYKNLYGVDSVNNRRFYNICAGGHYGFGGKFSHPCWTNVDVIRPVNKNDNVYNPDRDIEHDLLSMQTLPIESNSAELVFCQYAIEHITNDAAKFFFKEVERILKPGGVFRIVTPNIELDYHAYQNNDMHYFHWIEHMSIPAVYEELGFKIPLNKASFEQVVIAHFAANASTIHVGSNPNRIEDEEFREIMKTLPKEEALDHCINKCSAEVQKQFRHNHMNWWNHNKLIKFLNEAGFSNHKIIAPGQSSAPVMRNRQHFDILWNEVALFVEGIKE